MENTSNDEHMKKGYKLKDAREILQVNEKTFTDWLEQKGIKPQRNPRDPREKLLTPEQILLLGKDHGREVHFPPPGHVTDAKALVTRATLDEGLAELKQVFVHRLDQLEELVRTLKASLERNLAQSIPSPQVHPLAAPPPQDAPTRTRVSAKQRAKKAARSKRLPRPLIPLHVFRTMHGISQKAAEYAVEAGKLPVVRGKWLYQNRYTTAALDGQGRQQFYALFHERESFQHCKACPHTEQ